MMSEDLKACPFCGEQPELRNDDDDVMREIVCSNCDFAITESANPNGAVARWNTRPQSDRIEKLVEALRPFVMALDECGDDEGESDFRDIWDHALALNVTIGDFRRARTALNEDTSHVG